MVDLTKLTREDREFQSYDLNTDGAVAQRVIAELSSALEAALKPEGLTDFTITTLTVSDAETALPTTPLTGRRSMAIKNKGTSTLYIGKTGLTADSVTGTTSGWELEPNGVQNFQFAADVVLYGRCESGESTQVKVFEIL